MKTRIKKPQCYPLGNNCLPTIHPSLAETLPSRTAPPARIVPKDKRVTIVGSARDGSKALCNASTLGPDLAVTDLQMSGLDGAEVTRRLKQRPNSPTVFIMTSDDTTEARARSMAAGADVFLMKAGNLAPQLISAIQEFSPAISNRTVPNQNNSMLNREQPWF